MLECEMLRTCFNALIKFVYSFKYDVIGQEFDEICMLF